MVRHLHAVHVDQLDAGAVGERVGHLLGRHVLALPAEGVADAVDEVEVAVLVVAQQVAGAPEGVALLEDVAQDLLLGGLGRGVALEAAAADLRVIDDVPQPLPHFARLAQQVETLVVPRVGVALDVVAHQPEVGLLPVGHPAAGADAVVHVDQRRVGLGGAPAFEDLHAAEALDPALPALRCQAGAHHAAQAVLAVVGAGRLVEKVAADLADVLADGDALLAHVLPELPRAELAAQRDGRAGAQRGGGHRGGGCAVVKGQAAVEHVVRRGPDGHLHHIAGAEPAHVAVAGRLGQAGGAGGEDQQGRRLGGDGGPVAAREGLARRGGHLGGEGHVGHAGSRVLARLLGIGQAPQGQVGQPLGGREVGQALLAHHRGAGLGGLQRMHQGPAADLGVDEGHHDPQLGQAEPGEEEVRPVLHRQRAHVARAQAAGEGGVGHLVGAGVHLGIAEALPAIQQEGALALAARRLLHAVGQGVQVGGLDQGAGRGAAVQPLLGELPGHAALGLVSQIRWCIVCVHAHVSPVCCAGCGGLGGGRPAPLFRCWAFAPTIIRLPGAGNIVRKD